ncbi:hypothetical protein GCM10009819_02550 [Agromyces tropicus]|uniref:Lipoprotein n=1 Tax=Agromyces tropicus TaxID=555371 RepID=A0ABN2TWE4_9MICO
MRARTLLLGLVIAGAVLSTTGCAAATAKAGSGVAREDLPPIQQSLEQRSALADDSVTRGEYTSAFSRYRDCLKDDGFEVVSIKERGNLIEYSVPADAVSTGSDDRCYLSEFAEIDQRWQLAHEDESFTTKMYQACLNASGVPASESATEVWAQLEANGLDEKSCLAYAEDVQ